MILLLTSQALGSQGGEGEWICYLQAHSCPSLCHFPAPELAHLSISSLDSSPGCLSDPTETFFFFSPGKQSSEQHEEWGWEGFIVKGLEGQGEPWEGQGEPWESQA